MKPNHFNSIFRSLFHRESIANSATTDAREAAIANALDPSDAIDFSDTADGWFKISPYGQFRGKVPGRPQVVSQGNATAMVEEFNSVLGKLGRAFRGVPIYHGHPDVDPEIWTGDRRIGKITKLEARADGLWGLAEWNSIGQENKAEGWWIYPSPRWDAPAGKAAAVLGCGTWTISDLFQMGLLTGSKPGERVLVRSDGKASNAILRLDADSALQYKQRQEQAARDWQAAQKNASVDSTGSRAAARMMHGTCKDQFT